MQKPADIVNGFVMSQPTVTRPAQGQLSGSRIRARRLDLGIAQVDLAWSAGISPSYLNLIEHNRRRIGGKLLGDIARVLGVEAASLTEGAERALLDQLRAAAAADAASGVEIGRTEEFAGRFPGWAALVATQARQVAALADRVQALTDRLAHDPQLATALHEVISAVTSIRSTASILVSDDAIDADWQQRFHKNLYADSQRLTASSTALIGYLEAPDTAGGGPLSPQELVERFMADLGGHVAALEADPAVETPAGLAASALTDPAAGHLATQWLTQYAADARALPLAPFSEAARTLGDDPVALARQFGRPLAQVLRRLATLPPDAGLPQTGLAICDGSGALTHLKPVAGFALPRGGAACPLWPLYQALSQPGQPIRRAVTLPGDPARRFLCYAIATPVEDAGFDRPARVAATMLLVPDPPADMALAPVGYSCRICPRDACAARREPSILSDSGAASQLRAI
jgi:transcriptional regulator with XRE-family HTH domain